MLTAALCSAAVISFLTGFIPHNNVSSTPAGIDRASPVRSITAFQEPFDGGWVEGFELPGPDMGVNALAVDQHGVLYAGGAFVTAGGVQVNYVARWDGSHWSSLGDGLPAPANILALDSRGNLYTPVLAFDAGGNALTRLLQWDGSSWDILGGDLEVFIDTVLEGREANLSITGLGVDGRDRIHIAGSFYLSQAERYVGFVARWDGAAWSLLGGSMDHAVYSLAVDGQGTVYAGGEFTTAGGKPASRVARWDGSAWRALGEGFQETPSSLALDMGGNLYAAVNGYPVSIARWDGSAWNTIGVSGGEVNAISSLAVGMNGDLYAGGYFTSMDGVPASHIARWDGSSWRAMGEGLNREVNALVAGPGGVVYAGGFFSQAGGDLANFLARWDGDAWQALNEPMGNGLNLMVNAFAAGGSGNLYTGGYFTTAGDLRASRVARWDGASWSRLGDGMNAAVHALALGDGGHLYAGGEFTMAGDVDANRVAMWDGASWSALGDGVDGSIVRALAVDRWGNLYAGGDFTAAGGNEANYVAMWDGTSWHALGEGVDNWVNALLVDDRGNVYAGGWFGRAGAVDANGIAVWDGSKWSALGNGLGIVWALAIDSQGQLYAGGDFSLEGAAGGKGIAVWDGASWSAVGGGVEADLSRSFPSVTALVVDSRGYLFAGGGFTMAGSVHADHIAVWDGGSWWALGSGLQGRDDYTYFTMVNALALDGKGGLYAGGDFHRAGGAASVHIARWNYPSEAGRKPSTERADGNQSGSTPRSAQHGAALPGISGVSSATPVPTPDPEIATALVPWSEAGSYVPGMAALAALIFALGAFVMARSIIRRGKNGPWF